MEYTREELTQNHEFYFQWHITEKCNLRCKHCYHESYNSKDELTSAQLDLAFSKMEQALKKWNLKGSASITGGEPFLRREDMFRIATMMDNSSHFSYYDILTNGSLITDEDLTRLTNLSSLRRVQLSLESPFENINDSIRGPGSFKNTLEAIRKLKCYGLQVSVMMTVTKVNQHDFPEMVELLAKEKVDAVAVERFIPEGSGSSICNMMLSKKETKRFYELVYNIGIKEKRIRVLMHRPLFALLDANDSSVGAMCSVGNNALTIMHDGTIYPCRRLPIAIGNIIEDGIFKPWYDSDILWSVRNINEIKGKCGKCDLLPLCRGCRAMAYWANGDYLGEDPHCWKEIKVSTN